MIDGETKVHSLYGFPVAHSLSPLIFNRTFEKLGQNRTYIPFPVAPRDLRRAVDAARSLGFEGFNVTMPHKTAIAELLDALEGSAAKTSSVNTVTRSSRGLVGYNTDGEGALRALKANGFNPSGRNILVVGAGGAARAVVQSLSQNASEIRVLNRTLEKAREIGEKAEGRAKVSYGELTRASLEKCLPNVDLMVNSTPLQTASLLRELNVPFQDLPSALWVFDLAYDKSQEPLPAQIRRVSPMEMLVQQAALSYEIWLREPAPFELMRSILVEHIGADWK